MDGNGISEMEINGNARNGSISKLTERLHLFVQSFYKTLKRRLEQCKRNGEIGATPETTSNAEIVGGVGQAAGAAAAYAIAPNLIGAGSSAGGKIAEKMFGFRSIEKEKQHSREVTEAFRTLDVDELLELSVQAAGLVFFIFEPQFMCVTDSKGSVLCGIQKLANDAVTRLLRFVRKNLKSNEKITLELMVKGVLNGKSASTGICNSLIPTNYFVASRLGHSIKLKGQLKGQLKTSELYGNCGIVTVKDDGTTEKNYGVSSTCHFRRILEWERAEQLPSELPPRKNSYQYVMTRQFLDAELAMIKEDLSKNDVAKKTDIILENSLNTSATSEQILGLTNKIHDIVNISKEDMKLEHVFNQRTKFLRYFVFKCPALKEIDWFNQSQIDWNEVVRRILLRIKFETNGGKLTTRYAVTTRDATEEFEVAVYDLDEESYSSYHGSVVTIHDGKITIKEAGEDEQLEYTLSDMGTSSLTLLVGLGALKEDNILTSRVALFTSSTVPLSNIEARINEFGTFIPRAVVWNDIDEKTKKIVVATGQLEIQQQKYPLIQFKSVCHHLEGDQLNQLLRENPLRLFSDPCTDDEPRYVERYIEYKKVEEIFFESNDLYLVYGFDPEAGHSIGWLHKRQSQIYSEPHIMLYMKEIRSNIVQAPYISSYEKIVNRLQELGQGRPVHLVRYRTDQTLVWLRPEREVFSDPECKVLFVVAAPGHGKTRLLQNLYESSNFSDTVNISITSQELIRLKRSSSLNIPLDINIASLRGNTKFDSQILQKLKILLLLDGVDEIKTSSDATVLVDIIQELTRKYRFRVVATVGDQMETEVKRLFPSVPVVKLADVLQDCQKEIISEHWAMTLENVDLEKPADIIVHSHISELNGSPLRCKMVADIYREEVDRVPAIEWRSHPKHLVLQNIVDKTFERFMAKNGVTDPESKLYASNKEDFNNTHTYLSLEQLYPECTEQFKHPPSPCKRALAHDQGLLTNVVDPTLANYFVDEWVFKVLIGADKVVSRDDFIEWFKGRYDLLLESVHKRNPKWASVPSPVILTEETPLHTQIIFNSYFTEKITSENDRFYIAPKDQSGQRAKEQAGCILQTILSELRSVESEEIKLEKANEIETTEAQVNQSPSI